MQTATQPAVGVRPLEVVRGYVALTKPTIIVLLLITTIPAMVLASGGWPDVRLVLATLLGAMGAAALRALAGVVLVTLALVVAGVLRPAAALERVGVRFWRRLQPLAAALRRDLGGANALALGFLWGWLPCGLVYGALGWAATTGGPGPAALVMTGFGLGTLPGVMLPTVAAWKLGAIVQARSSRRVAAVMLAAFGVWTLVGAATMLHAARSGAQCHGGATTSPGLGE